MGTVFYLLYIYIYIYITVINLKHRTRLEVHERIIIKGDLQM